MNARTLLAVGGFILLFLAQFPACSILTPVGDAISSGYGNTVAYFNAYYNASRAFSEAETEILTAERLSRGKTQPQSATPQIPPAAKAKLNTAIDKCSNILAFHSTSALVDDALLMIGKSFFYSGEYIKAERKFSELITRFPSSELQIEAQYWYSRCQDRLRNDEAALTACEALIAAAREEEHEEIEFKAHILKAAIFKRQELYPQAAEELSVALNLPADDEQLLETRIALGDVHFAAGRYELAQTHYLAVAEETDDQFEGYYSRTQAAIAARNNGNHPRSRQLLEEAAEDFRFKEWLPAIKYELGRTLAASDLTDEAITAYQFVDTSQVRTDYSPRAAFELASIYEVDFQDYSEANRYYGRASAASDPATNAKAKQKAAAFRRYFEVHKQIYDLDSTWKAEQDTLEKLAADTIIATLPDSLRPKPYFATLNADTVLKKRALSHLELGDLFYSEFEVPDSAIHYYNTSMGAWIDPVRTPRVFYILAEIARSHPDRGYRPPSYYDSLLTLRYPRSEYALAVLSRQRGEQVQIVTDPALGLYRDAESAIDSGQPERALAVLDTIIKRYPASPYAAKSSFAIAWLYEHRLGLRDSAIAQYRRVSDSYGKTPFAAAAARRFVPLEAPRDTTKKDSAGVKPTPVGPAATGPRRLAPTVNPDSLNPQSPASRRERRPAEEIE